jgi:hypothetical protein
VINSERAALNAPDFRPLIRTKETLLTQIVKSLLSVNNNPGMNLLKKMPWGATTTDKNKDHKEEKKKKSSSSSKTKKTSSESSSESKPATPLTSHVVARTSQEKPPVIEVKVTNPQGESSSVGMTLDRSPSVGNEGSEKERVGNRRSKTFDADYQTMYKKLEL